MSKGLFGSVACLLIGAGLASGQATLGPPVESSSRCESFCYFAGPAKSRFWFGSEYLNWWFQGSPVPVPLATTGPLAPGGIPFGVAPNIPGSLSAPGTQILLGNQNINTGNHSGARFTLGRWLDDSERLGVEANYFFVGGHSATRAASSNGAALLTVPFRDVGVAPGENTLILVAPGNSAFASGSAILSVTNSLQGAEFNGIYNLSQRNALFIDLVGGFRYLQFRENLDFSTNSSGVGGNAGIDNTLDLFRTNNNFYGGQLGLRAEYAMGRLYFRLSEKIGLGGVDEHVSIHGATLTTFNPVSGGAVQTFPGGVFAQPTNIGDYSRDRLAFVNELIVTTGYQLRDRARVFVGYNFLFINHVARPGSQLDRTINDTQFQATIPPPGPLSGEARPAFTFRDSSFWAQGISAGFEIRY